MKESFWIKGRQPFIEKLPESIESSKFVSHRARMSGKFDLGKIQIQQNKKEGLKNIHKAKF